MRAEVLAVGTEILLGQIANTNAQTISRALASIGIDVLFHTVVGDNERRIAGLIDEALARSDVLIVTGGLGPTHDDLTREAIARVTGRPLERRADLEEGLRARFAFLGREMAETNLRQADQPRDATAIPNPRGTAPGVFVEHDGKRIFALPGVPHEMEAMLVDWVIPKIGAVSGGSVLVSRVVKVAGVPESDLAQQLQPLIASLDAGPRPNATIALLAGAGEIAVRITAKGGDEKDARARILPVEEEVRRILGAAVFGTDTDTLESVIAQMMIAKDLTLAVAESVTGGLVASRIVGVPGASKFLRAAYVAYSIDSKVNDLGVARETIESHGSVSEETAVAMARGASARASSDIGLAVTGEAGPEVSEAKLGSVFIALTAGEVVSTRQFVAPGDRGLVRRWAALGALNLLRLWLMGEIH